MSEPFTAEIRMFAGNFAPRGWAFCDGQLLPIANNTALFSLIGTTYGGDGRSTTALPDLQGRSAMHPGRGPGLTSRRLGERLGVDAVTLTESQIPRHTHTMGGVQGPLTQTSPGGNSYGLAPLYNSAAGSNEFLAPEAVGMTGGNQSHTNDQPYLVVNFIIALVGLYPSRP